VLCDHPLFVRRDAQTGTAFLRLGPGHRVLVGNIMRVYRKHKAIEPTLYIIGQKAEIGFHRLPKSRTFTVNLPQPLIEVFVALPQFMELAQFLASLRIRCFAHRILKGRDAKSQGFDAHFQC